MAAPSVTHTFSNSTTADATQVNTNFTDLINGASDGTKDYDINSLQTRGTTTLGNATTDDLVVTARLASDLIPKTDAAYNLGSADLGFGALYLGDADAETVKIQAPAMSADWVLTLPADDGANGQFLRTDGAGTATTWARPFSYTSITASDTLGALTTHLDADADLGAVTVTIPAASTALAGQTTWIRKIGTTTSYTAITLQTGVSTTLNTYGEAVCIHCTGSAWVIIERVIPSNAIAFTPTFTGLGTVSGSSFNTYRIGSSVRVIGEVTSGTVSADALTLTLPSTVTVKGGTNTMFGFWTRDVGTGNVIKRGIIRAADDASVVSIGIDDYTTATSPFTALTGSGLFGGGASGVKLSFDFTVPTNEWDG